MRDIRIVMADDYPVVRQGLRQTIEANPGIAIVGEASDGEAALAQIMAGRVRARAERVRTTRQEVLW